MILAGCVAVEVQGDLDAAMAEAFADDLDVRPGSKLERRVGVTELMQGDRGDDGVGDQAPVKVLSSLEWKQDAVAPFEDEPEVRPPDGGQAATLLLGGPSA